MPKVINFQVARRLRQLYNDYRAQGGRAFILQGGRTPGKTMSPDAILDMLESIRRPVSLKGVGGKIDLPPPGRGDWYCVGGRAEDALKQLPTATIIPFPGGRG